MFQEVTGPGDARLLHELARTHTMVPAKDGRKVGRAKAVISGDVGNIKGMIEVIQEVTRRGLGHLGLAGDGGGNWHPVGDSLE